MKKLLLAVALASALVACNTSADDAAAKAPPIPQPSGWKAVLIAGDNQEPAFDNAVDAMAAKLTSFGVPRSDISILKATSVDQHAATRANIRRAFAELNPAPTDGCFVFITSHGGEGRGLVLARDPRCGDSRCRSGGGDGGRPGLGAGLARAGGFGR